MDNENNDILDMVRNAENEAQRLATRALIIQPGAIGDCVLTLPLAEFLKKQLDIGSVQMLGKSYYLELFPGRTCIDGIKDIDSVDLHRLFVQKDKFELEDDDPLINAFAGFKQIITFLGESGGDFEANLIFTAYCSNPAEITTLKLKPPADFKKHISDFYLNSFVASLPSDTALAGKKLSCDLEKKYITAGSSDLTEGRKILKIAGIKTGQPVVVIHPGSGSMSKCWCIDNFYMLAEQLCDENIKIVFILGPAEMERFKKKTIDALNAIASVLCELSLTETFQVVSASNCFIGNDSGITHLSAAAGIPTIAFFGPSNLQQYCPVGPKVWTLKLELSDFNSPCPEKVQQATKLAIQCLNP